MHRILRTIRPSRKTSSSRHYSKISTIFTFPSPPLLIMSPYNFFLLIFFSNFQFSRSIDNTLPRKTLIISLDAFRYDYVTKIRDLMLAKNQKSNIWQLAQNGAFAEEGITPTFATETRPILYSVATGLYEESHGIVSETIYDPILNKSIDLFGSFFNEKENSWIFQGGEPIWKTLRDQTQKGKDEIVGCIMWFGCQAAGLKRYKDWTDVGTLEKKIDTAIDWLETGSDLVLVYDQGVDRIAGMSGPDSQEINQYLLDLDSEVGKLIMKLNAKKMTEMVNLIILGDHGRMEVKGTVFEKRKFFSPPIEIRSRSPAMWLVEPMPGKYNETIRQFAKTPNLSVIEKNKTPERWYYRNNDRITPLILLADPGYTLESYSGQGAYGYDNAVKQMRPFFIGSGPAFIAKSSIHPEMSVVDIYLLLCRIQNVRPAPNNGSESRLSNFVKSTYMDPPASGQSGGVSYSITEGGVEDPVPMDQTTYRGLIVMAVAVGLVLLVLLILLIYAIARSLQSSRRTWPQKAALASDKKDNFGTFAENESDDEEHRTIRPVLS